jgi:hypothetical protein
MGRDGEGAVAVVGALAVAAVVVAAAAAVVGAVAVVVATLANDRRPSKWRARCTTWRGPGTKMA